ncbi:tryptophan halogenase [Haloferula helveola]|uniref:Tryptophan halogenase n=1 Tax=Haloferula helveola TaxID=490095 RepID=A0ABN6H6R5_9BACT|nr:tryptophan halogenase [Haloferula helveola]
MGGGSAGLLAALTLRRLVPEIDVTLVHSSEIGVIGVGEGTTAVFPDHLFTTLGIDPAEFYREAEPTWKQGIKFVWGPRDWFFYDFEEQYDWRFDGLPKPNGYYAEEDCTDLSSACALMSRGKAFASGPLGKPLVKGNYAFHIENHKLVECLTRLAREAGVKFVDDTLQGVERDAHGVKEVRFEKSGALSADLYIDASGFRAELIGKALEEPFNDYSGALFCDRAVIGGWEREDETLLAYTTAETMDHGWCWQIEHENFINRGYVFSSRFVDDDEAVEEFRSKNPKVGGDPRVVRFRSGRHQRNWVGNVVAIGNASGFVEPLEATAIAQIIYEVRWLAETLQLTDRMPDDRMREFFNQKVASAWDEIRDFLAYHYKFNTRLETPFWKACREDVGLGDYQGLYDAYREIGPSQLLVESLPTRPNIYGIEGFLAMLVGMKVPYANRYEPEAEERAAWESARGRLGRAASAGVTVSQALNAIRKPTWKWS